MGGADLLDAVRYPDDVGNSPELGCADADDSLAEWCLGRPSFAVEEYAGKIGLHTAAAQKLPLPCAERVMQSRAGGIPSTDPDNRLRDAVEGGEGARELLLPT